MTSPTERTIDAAVAALVADYEIPEPFITHEDGGGFFRPFTRTRITLPNSDGDELVIAADDNEAVITRCDPQFGVVLDLVRLTNPRTRILRAVLAAFVAEALSEEA